MIRKNIQDHFPSHLDNCTTTCSHLYIADYTEQTKSRKGTKLFCDPPSDIDYFEVYNPSNLELDGIPFDNRSFTCPDGNSLSQCECVVYPYSSNGESWILFLELKYSDRIKNNRCNLEKALKQLFKTQYYYRSRGIFDKNNTCYLLASLPMQRPPFANISLTQNYLLGMKKKHNVVIRFQNSVEIIDDEKIKV